MINKRISIHVFSSTRGSVFSSGRLYNFPTPLRNVTGWRVVSLYIGDSPALATTSSFIVCSSLCPTELISSINGSPNSVIFSSPSTALLPSVVTNNFQFDWNYWVKRDLTTIDFSIKDQDANFINVPFVITLEIEQTY